MVPPFAVGISVPALIVLGIVVLLLFGNRLPGVMRSLGRGIVEFKKGLHGADDAADGENKKIEESAAKSAVNQNESAVKREEAVEKK